ncbi:MAG: MFS transporter [Candidatus Puniceispirillales bacterium]
MKGLLLVVFVNFVGIGALIPVLPYAVIDVAGGSETNMALLMASFAFAMFVGAPILGSLSDRFGRRRVLLASILVSAVAHAGFALSVDLVPMFITRLIAGLASGNISVIQAIITDTTGEKERARWMGMMGAFVGLGFVAGPALGGLLSGVGGAVHMAPFLLAAGLALLGFVLAALNVSETITPHQPQQPTSLGRKIAALAGSGLAGFAVAGFLLNLGFAQVEVSFVLVLKDVLGYSSLNTGWVFTWIGIIIVIVQGGMIGPLTRRFGDLPVAISGALLLMLGQIVTVMMIPVGFVFGGMALAGVLVATGLVCVGFALTNPTLAAATSKRSREGAVGGSLGVVQGFGSLGQVGGLLMAGPLYEMGGGGLTFGIGGLASMVLAGCLILVANGSQPTPTAHGR